MKKTKRTIHFYIKDGNLEGEHALLKHIPLEEKELTTPNQETTPETVDTNNIWPLEPNILIENAQYDQNNSQLIVSLTNLSVEPIKIIQRGVKYSPSETESINFENVDITLPPGENTISISAPAGNPFKFVIRTSNKTGSGQTRDEINW
ncbi:MAG: hypothetical protein ISS25_01900 [Nanoarchaeota archaeon]|nr:hypothetical protein [DPANN group archaeon]MBL7116559.1 hypothetical protein [Nanoarchaeota archaeon]